MVGPFADLCSLPATKHTVDDSMYDLLKSICSYADVDESRQIPEQTLSEPPTTARLPEEDESDLETHSACGLMSELLAKLTARMSRSPSA
jgi:hypothetical protein